MPGELLLLLVTANDVQTPHRPQHNFIRKLQGQEAIKLGSGNYDNSPSLVLEPKNR